MKIISLIHELDIIERILRHLGLWKQYPDPHEGKIGSSWISVINRQAREDSTAVIPACFQPESITAS